MKLSDSIAAGALVLALGLACGFGAAKWQQPNVAVPTVPVPVTSPAALSVSQPLTGFPNQAKQLSAFYRDFAKVLAVAPQVKTTGDFREAHKLSLTIFVAGEKYAGAPAVGALVDAYFESLLGKEDIPLDAKRATLITGCEDLSRALANVK